MFNLQGSEIIVILLLALVVLGPEKLPDAIRKFSQTYGELKKMGTGFQSELKSALDEPMREMRETADLVQRAADPSRIAEEAENEARLRAEADAASLNGAGDVPVNPAALAVSDPVAAAETARAADEADEADADDTPDAVSPGAAPSIGKPTNGEQVKQVNQIALSMARGPIDPEPDLVTVPAADTADDAANTANTGDVTTTPLTAMPQGAASMMAPPSPGTVVPDAPAPPAPRLPPAGGSADEREASAP